MKPQPQGGKYSDWRHPLPTRACVECGAAETGCEANQMFSGRRCCESCDHPDTNRCATCGVLVILGHLDDCEAIE